MTLRLEIRISLRLKRCSDTEMQIKLLFLATVKDFSCRVDKKVTDW